MPHQIGPVLIKTGPILFMLLIHYSGGFQKGATAAVCKKRKSEISASAWGAQHPNTGQNIQQ